MDASGHSLKRNSFKQRRLLLLLLLIIIIIEATQAVGGPSKIPEHFGNEWDSRELFEAFGSGWQFVLVSNTVLASKNSELLEVYCRVNGHLSMWLWNVNGCCRNHIYIWRKLSEVTGNL